MDLYKYEPDTIRIVFRREQKRCPADIFVPYGSVARKPQINYVCENASLGLETENREPGRVQQTVEEVMDRPSSGIRRAANPVDPDSLKRADDPINPTALLRGEVEEASVFDLDAAERRLPG